MICDLNIWSDLFLSTLSLIFLYSIKNDTQRSIRWDHQREETHILLPVKRNQRCVCAFV